MKNNEENKLYSAHSFAAECCGNGVLTVHWMVTDRFKESEGFEKTGANQNFETKCVQTFERGLFTENELEEFQMFMWENYHTEVFAQAHQVPLRVTPEHLLCKPWHRRVEINKNYDDFSFYVEGHYYSPNRMQAEFPVGQKLEMATDFFMNVFDQLGAKGTLDANKLQRAISSVCEQGNYSVRKTNEHK